MDKNLQKAAEDFMSTAEGQKIVGKKDELKNLAASEDGKEVRDILARGGFENAVKSGDTAAIKDTLNQVMGTESGSRLLKQLQKMMGN